MNTKVDEGKLISGKEALIALANDQDVEYMDTSNTFKSLGWSNAFGLETNLFFSDRFKFRLKPRTITINGIECPAPILWDSLPEGTKFWIADPSRHDGEFCRHLVWDGQDCDVQHLQRGLVHLSKQDAIEHAKAIILSSGGSYE
ncbi:hypothetical protein PFCIP103579_0337 [Prolinoborus fasciculus]|nr:hypothetical protein [Prolinoborus fasciculus]SPJ19193.1 hypothetical protein PFCIP103579_0337 [Prolinoborus fasciculus]